MIQKNTYDRLRNKLQKNSVKLKTVGELKYMNIHIEIHTHRDYLYIYIIIYHCIFCRYVSMYYMNIKWYIIALNKLCKYICKLYKYIYLNLYNYVSI